MTILLVRTLFDDRFGRVTSYKMNMPIHTQMVIKNKKNLREIVERKDKLTFYPKLMVVDRAVGRAGQSAGFMDVNHKLKRDSHAFCSLSPQVRLIPYRRAMTLDPARRRADRSRAGSPCRIDGDRYLVSPRLAPLSAG